MPKGRKSLTIEQKNLELINAANETGWTIDPLRCRWMPYWEVIITVTLVFTAVETPYEITFVDEGPCVTPLFIVNRVVDLCFILDGVLQFLAHYQDDKTGIWVRDQDRIISHYLRGWFIIDLLSVTPFWLPNFIVDADVQCSFQHGRIFEEEIGSGGEILTASTSNPAARASQAVRLVRLLRMLRLARMAKASKVLQRFLVDILVTKLEMTFASMTCGWLLIVMIIVAHLQACFWALCSLYQEGANHTWVGSFRQSEIDAGRPDPTPFTLYTASLYWSIMTLTSIGYGDIVPENDTERWVCIFLMLVSGATWAYVIGQVAGIATTMDPNLINYRTTMDALNFFMRDRQLPAHMRHALRDYFSDARIVHQIEGESDLLQKMSPMLQGIVALEASREWLDQVWFLKGLGTTRNEKDFIAALSMALQMRAYSIEERLPLGQMYVLRRGMIVRLWRFLGKGRVWGEDMLIEDPELRNHAQGVALTFIETFVLTKADLVSLGADFPGPWQKICSAMQRVTIGRKILLLHAKHTGRKPRSYIPASCASGYSEVANIISVEKKVEDLGKGWTHFLKKTATSNEELEAEEAEKERVNQAEEVLIAAKAAAAKGLSLLVVAAPAPAAAPAAAKAAEVVNGEQISPRLDQEAVSPSTVVPSSEAARGMQQTLAAVVRMQEALFLSMQSQSQSLLDMGAMQRQMQSEMQSMRNVQLQSTPYSRNLREARAMGGSVFA